ncbi:MAG: dihydrodipicolinate synthase family protein, partial [Lachnospiraceae bacterium]|nr:dihydrodipicolinate synthase family protein [Lachnospiraceae bacterium]
KYLAGDTKGSLELQLKYLPLVEALFTEVNPIPVKAAMNLMGMEVGEPRMPLTPMEAAHVDVLREELQKVGLL